MIDLSQVYEIRNVVNDKVIDKIEDDLGNVLYEAFSSLTISGTPPLTLLKSKGADLIDYKIYGNSVQDGTPTPDTPVEIESVGDKTSNLFDNDINENLVKKDGNDLVLSKYACSTGMKPSQFLAMTGLKVGDTFTIKRTFTVEKGTKNNVTGAMRFLKSSSGSWQLISGTQSINTVTIPADFNDNNYTYLYMYGALTEDENGELLTRFKKIQIAKGSYSSSTMPAYEPYGYRIPIKVSGKNLFDVNDAYNTTYEYEVDEDGWIRATYDNSNGTGTIWRGIYTNASNKIKPNTPYRIIAEIAEISNCNLTAVSSNAQYNPGQFAVGKNFDTVGIHIFTATSRADLSISKTMIRTEMVIPAGQIASVKCRLSVLEDTSVTADTFKYEPYVEPITTNIYLNEPLRKIGDYADYIDFENQIIKRNIYQGKLVNILPGSQGSQYTSGLCRRQGGTTPRANYDIAPISNCLEGYSGNIQGYANKITFVSTYSNGYVYFNASDVGLEPVTDTTTNTTIGTAINNYMIEHNMDLTYVLAQPIEKTIQLPNIPTIKGTTVIEVDTNIKPSNMEVAYLGKQS